MPCCTAWHLPSSALCRSELLLLCAVLCYTVLGLAAAPHYTLTSGAYSNSMCKQALSVCRGLRPLANAQGQNSVSSDLRCMALAGWSQGTAQEGAPQEGPLQAHIVTASSDATMSLLHFDVHTCRSARMLTHVNMLLEYISSFLGVFCGTNMRYCKIQWAWVPAPAFCIAPCFCWYSLIAICIAPCSCWSSFITSCAAYVRTSTLRFSCASLYAQSFRFCLLAEIVSARLLLLASFLHLCFLPRCFHMYDIIMHIQMSHAAAHQHDSTPTLQSSGLFHHHFRIPLTTMYTHVRSLSCMSVAPQFTLMDWYFGHSAAAAT